MSRSLEMLKSDLARVQDEWAVTRHDRVLYARLHGTLSLLCHDLFYSKAQCIMMWPSGHSITLIEKSAVTDASTLRQKAVEEKLFRRPPITMSVSAFVQVALAS